MAPVHAGTSHGFVQQRNIRKKQHSNLLLNVDMGYAFALVQAGMGYDCTWAQVVSYSGVVHNSVSIEFASFSVHTVRITSLCGKG